MVVRQQVEAVQCSLKRLCGTLSRVCMTVSNSLNPSRVYIRLFNHGKRFLLLKSLLLSLLLLLLFRYIETQFDGALESSFHFSRTFVCAVPSNAILEELHLCNGCYNAIFFLFFPVLFSFYVVRVQ